MADSRALPCTRGCASGKVEVRWVAGLPPAELLVTQAYGWCFTPAGALIVLEADGQYTLPGGKPEGGETLAETVRREAREEAQLELGAIRLSSAADPMPRRASASR